MKMKNYNVWIQLWAFVRRNLDLSKKYIGWEIVFLIYHIVGALAIGFLAKSMDAAGDQFDSLMLFLLIGSVMWVYLSSIFHEVGAQIAYERWEGTIEYTFMAPVRRICHLVGNSVFAIIYGIAKTWIVLLCVVLVFSIDMSNANYLASMAVIVMSALSFIGMGMVVSIVPLMTPERGTQVLHIVEAVMMLVSGIYYDVGVLPSWMQTIAQFSPATYALEGMRLAMIHNSSVRDIWMSHLVPLLVMGMVFIPLGSFVFGFAEQRAKKRGLLKRNG